MTYNTCILFFLTHIIYPKKEWNIMPRKSPYTITLSRKERVELERISRKYTSLYCDVIRSKVILLCAQGFRNKEIGERLDLPRQIVSKWRKRFFHKRMDGLCDQSRKGRPVIPSF